MSSKKGLDLLYAISKYMTDCTGHDQVLKNVKILGGGDGICKAEMLVGPEHLNRGGGLHGGLSSTIVDIVSTYALMTHNTENVKAGVSVDLHITFLKGARENDEILIEAKTLRCGKNLAYLECEIRNKKCNSLLVRGTHTKYVGSG